MICDGDERYSIAAAKAQGGIGDKLKRSQFKRMIAIRCLPNMNSLIVDVAMQLVDVHHVHTLCGFQQPVEHIRRQQHRKLTGALKQKLFYGVCGLAI